MITVGPAVTLSNVDGYGGTLLATATGFGAFSTTAGSDESTTITSWLPLDRSGTPGTPIPLGADLSAMAPGIEAITVGDHVVFSMVDNTDAMRILVGFDPVSGGRSTGATSFVLPLGTGESPGARAILVGASTTRVTAYVAHYNAHASIERFRLDFAGSTPTVVASRDIATDVGAFGLAVLSTPDVDYVAYAQTTGQIQLLAGPSGDAAGSFHPVGTIGGTAPPTFDYASLAIRDASSPVSNSNPLGLAWAGRAGVSGAPATLSFAEVTNTTVFASTTLVSFPDAVGSSGGFFTARTVDLLALPDAAEHWILMSQDADALPVTGGLVQVREIIGAGSNVRRIPVPGETVGPRTDVGLAVSGGAIRILERGSSSGLVTRSIGCE